MQSIGGSLVAFSFLSIIKAILEMMVYISVITVSFKAVQALNVYINKNTK